ncbi:MAG: TIGR03862 family flavoprotein, partial [Leptothrix sp. (in: b-proteobacteria)]
MAAQVLADGGAQVDVVDAMPSVGRKFLLAGKGGLNLTHDEDASGFVGRYGAQADVVAPWLAAFGPQAIRDWAAGLGISTFVGSSGKVFPAEMKAAPLLRAWLHRLRAAGVRFHMRHRWTGALQPAASAVPGHAPGWTLAFTAPAGPVSFTADAVVLALGGGSWARLGSDGAWVPWLRAEGVAVDDLQPSNCGFDIGWSAHVADKHAGTPLKNIVLRVPALPGGVDSATGSADEPAPDTGSAPPRFSRLGEAVLTATGLEGNLVYAASGLLREAITLHGHAD